MPTSLQSLHAYLDDEDPQERIEAAKSAYWYARMGPEEAQEVVELLPRLSTHGQAALLEGLYKALAVYPRAAQYVAAFLRTSKPNVQVAGARSLGGATAVPEVVDVLSNIAQDINRDVAPRLAAINSLGAIAYRADVRELLENITLDSDTQVSRMARRVRWLESALNPPQDPSRIDGAVDAQTQIALIPDDGERAAALELVGELRRTVAALAESNELSLDVVTILEQIVLRLEALEAQIVVVVFGQEAALRGRFQLVTEAATAAGGLNAAVAIADRFNLPEIVLRGADHLLAFAQAVTHVPHPI